jgi:hypothetical protein
MTVAIASGNPMQTPREIPPISGHPPAATPSALDAVTLTGDEPQLPSSFRVAAAAQTSIAAAGLAAAEIWKLRSGQSQDVAVDMRHAVVECRSERYLRVDGKPPPPAWDAIAGVYKTGDAASCGCTPISASPRRRLQGAELQAGARRGAGRADAMGRRGVRDRGLCRRRRGRLMRSHDEWSATPHAQKALAELPLISIEKIGEAAPKPWPKGDRPLAGMRVLDLSRVIAGPVAGRTLAAHGADVMLISGPDLPAIPWLTIDTGRGKLTSFVELKSEQGRDVLRGLLARPIFSRKAIGRARSPRSASRRRTRQRSIPASSM